MNSWMITHISNKSLFLEEEIKAHVISWATALQFTSLNFDPVYRLWLWRPVRDYYWLGSLMSNARSLWLIEIKNLPCSTLKPSNKCSVRSYFYTSYTCMRCTNGLQVKTPHFNCVRPSGPGLVSPSTYVRNKMLPKFTFENSYTRDYSLLVLSSDASHWSSKSAKSMETLKL